MWQRILGTTAHQTHPNFWAKLAYASFWVASSSAPIMSHALCVLPSTGSWGIAWEKGGAWAPGSKEELSVL